MYIGRFYNNKEIFYGIIEGNDVFKVAGDIFADFKRTEERYNISELKYLAPTNTTKIVAVGLNYKDHARELNMPLPESPVIFMKPPTTVIAHNEKIIYPKSSNRVDYEAELAIIIKKEAYKVKRENAYDYILGYTCANDVTARDLQKKDGQWTRAKSFNTFCPLGPHIYIPDKNDKFDPHNLKIEAILNNKKVQSSNTSNLIFQLDYLIEFISDVMPLFAGDVIITGTPKGIGPLQVGDKIEISIEQIGTLTNYVG